MAWSFSIPYRRTSVEMTATTMQMVGFLRSLRPITELAHKPTILIPAHPTKNAGDDQLVPYGGGGILNEIDGNLTLSLKGDIVTLHYQDKLRGVPFDPTHYKSTLETADELMDQRGGVNPVAGAVPDGGRGPKGGRGKGA